MNIGSLGINVHDANETAARGQAEKTFSGTLTKVDAAKKVISVKGSGNEPEMTFMYDDKTQVTGEKTVEGLAGKSRAMLKVTSREEERTDRDENRGFRSEEVAAGSKEGRKRSRGKGPARQARSGPP